MNSSEISREEIYDGRFEQLSEELARIGRIFYSRGWLFGTSGNLSAVVGRDPLEIAITGSGLDKGDLKGSEILRIDGQKNVLSGKYKPSSETSLHLTLIRLMSAGAVFHTHSLAATILSEKYANEGGIAIRGYEMLKALEGVRTHEHTEWIPVLKNSQNMDSLAAELEKCIAENREMHGFLLSGHGLYTWGKTAADAKRHAEAIEFLMEVLRSTEFRLNKD